jgi:hypothetical protein
MRYLSLLALLVGCIPDRERQLAQCEVIVSGVTDALAACLVRDYDWGPDSATVAELGHDAKIWRERQENQVRRDSVAAAHERQERARARRAALEYCRGLGVQPSDCDTNTLMGVIP